MKNSFTRLEAALLLLVASLSAAALLGPPIAQHVHYHAFADQAMRWGVPHAMDVLSNLPFALVALVGGWRLAWVAPEALSPAERTMAWLFIGGLLLTAAGSSWYHWNPDDAGLVIDRSAMAVTFAGLLGLAACRVSERAGAALGGGILLLAPATVQVWVTTGNLLPWAVLQGGGMVLLLLLALVRPAGPVLTVRWLLILIAYGAAKAMEAGDHAIWQLSGEWISGHSLKHVIAAAATWPVVSALGALPRRRQNAAQALRTA